MNPISYQGGLSPEASEQVSSSLDVLLADYHIYQQNLRKMQWNQRTRVFFHLDDQLGQLYVSTDTSTDLLADRIMQLGHSPTASVSEALIKSNLVALDTGHDSYHDVFIQLLQDTHALLRQVRDVFDIASLYKDQRTIVLLGELGRYLNHNIWLFGSMRAAMYN